MKQEKERPRSSEKKYTESDMLAAFKHGREYEPFNSDEDIETISIPEKNRPFWGWVRIIDEQQSANTPDGKPL